MNFENVIGAMCFDDVMLKLIEELTGESLDALEPPFTSIDLRDKKEVLKFIEDP
ncbi:MAG: hypothetical protein QMC85_04405 [Methanocellales archaeon]|nr:hypothetical protein [Methanocellales archaeon]